MPSRSAPPRSPTRRPGRPTVAARLRRLEWLAETQAMLAELDFDLERFMDAVVQRVPQITDATGVIVELVDGEDMVYRATSPDLRQHLGLRLRRVGSLSGLCVASAEPLYCADAETDPRVDRTACARIGLRSMICLPLIAHGEPVGVLKALSTEVDGFDDVALDTLRPLAAALAAGLARQVAFEAMRRETEARRRLEASLRASEARYRLLAEKITDMIVTSDREGRITFVSPASYAMTGWTPQEAVGLRTEEFAHPDDLAALRDAFHRTGRGEANVRVRWRGRRHDGSGWIWLESRPSLLIEPDGTPSFVDVVRDVSQQVAREKAAIEAKDAAEAEAKAKSDFLANMSHEIRTPLTAVIGFSSLLRERGDLSEEASHHADRIDTAGRALLGLVNDILDLAKLEAGEVQMKPRPTVPAELAQEVLTLFQPLADQKGLRLALEAGPASSVLIDPQALRQILFNLVGNAVKFTSEGGVTVRLVAADGHLRVEVADTGAGLTPEQQARLFHRFAQVETAELAKTAGTGLGLSISKALSAAMGGEIGVEDAPGGGALFYVRVPAPEAVRVAEAQAEATASLEGVRILVADDQAANRELVRAMLEAVGAEVNDAEDGLAAVEAAKTWPYDVILMDLRMPRLDGAGALARIRSEPGPNDCVPILAFSAAEGHAPGFDGVIGKPILMRSLVAAIAAALEPIAWDDEGEAAAHG